LDFLGSGKKFTLPSAGLILASKEPSGKYIFSRLKVLVLAADIRKNHPIRPNDNTKYPIISRLFEIKIGFKANKVCKTRNFPYGICSKIRNMAKI
jgi:hypothetical protein